jgi:hypothetical protein
VDPHGAPPRSGPGPVPLLLDEAKQQPHERHPRRWLLLNSGSLFQTSASGEQQERLWADQPLLFPSRSTTAASGSVLIELTAAGARTTTRPPRPGTSETSFRNPAGTRF